MPRQRPTRTYVQSGPKITAYDWVGYHFDGNVPSDGGVDTPTIDRYFRPKIAYGGGEKFTLIRAVGRLSVSNLSSTLGAAGMCYVQGGSDWFASDDLPLCQFAVAEQTADVNNSDVVSFDVKGKRKLGENFLQYAPPSLPGAHSAPWAPVEPPIRIVSKGPINYVGNVMFLIGAR